MTRFFRQMLPFLLVSAIATSSLESCFIFHGKNNCGDCPNFKSNSKPKKVKKKKHR